MSCPRDTTLRDLKSRPDTRSSLASTPAAPDATVAGPGHAGGTLVTLLPSRRLLLPRSVASLGRAARTPCSERPVARREIPGRPVGSSVTRPHPSPSSAVHLRAIVAPPSTGQRHAGEVASVVGEQEHRDVSDVLRLRMMPEWHCALRAVLCFRSCECAGGHRRVDATRADAVRPYTARAVLHREQRVSASTPPLLAV